MSRKLITLVCTLCLVCVAIPALADVPWNGNFNEGTLDGWWTYTDGSANQSATIEAVGGYDGSPDAVLVNLAGANDKLGTNWFSITGGVTYTASFAFEEAATGGANTNVGLEFFDSGGNWIAGSYSNLWDTGGSWTTYSLTPIVAPSTAVSAQVLIVDWLGGTVTTHVDNVVVTPEPATMVLLGIGGLVALRRKHA